MSEHKIIDMQGGVELSAVPRQAVGMVPAEQVTNLMTQMAQAMQQQSMMMQSMADTIRVVNERMNDMERMMRAQMIKSPVTGAQTKALQTAINNRAKELAASYGMQSDRQIASLSRWIRKEVRETAALSSSVVVRAIGDIPACQYDVAMEQIAMWDDYGAISRIRRGV